jgi:hypothetical protein
MSWDAAIHGRLVISKDQREAWLDAKLDWPSVPGHDVWDANIENDTVRDVVEDGNFVDDAWFLEVAWDGDEIRVQAFLVKDTFNETLLEFAAAWAAAAQFGGRGELIGMGMLTASFGYRLTVKNGKAKFEELPEWKVFELDKHKDAKAIEKRVMQAGDAMAAEYLPAEKPKKKKAAKKKVAKKKAAKKKVAKKKVAKKKVAKKKVAKKKTRARS